MVIRNDKKHRHFILKGLTRTEPFQSQGGGNQTPIPERNREQHGKALQNQIQELKSHAVIATKAQQDAGLEVGLGLQVEFESFPDIELAFESLARDRQGIEISNVRQVGNRTHATVFVPDGKLDHFEGLVRDYLEEKRDSIGRPRDNQRLIDAIQEIRRASLRSLWTDANEEYPTVDEGQLWWEVWLPVRDNRQDVVNSFRLLAHEQEIRTTQGELKFPERTVLLAFASVEQMQHSILTLNSIAELRRPKETADFFDSLALEEQREWLDDLLDRTKFPAYDSEVPYVCLLDTGVNRGHRFLAPSISVEDLHTVEPAWEKDDIHGHGTQMAGVALVGNLTQSLVDEGPIQINHRLESVKMLQQEGSGENHTRQLHGILSIEAVSRPEITAPSRSRIFGMAVTAQDSRDRGRPSAWSATLDSLAANISGDDSHARLLIVSAGNIEDAFAWINYPASNETDGIHDPAQAWNVLTIGAFTNLVHITEPDTQGYTPIAQEGGLSPFSTTSIGWQSQWPIKPDVVFEGGNVAKDAIGAVWMPSLSLLTTHHLPDERLFTTTNATSAATALATRFAAQVMVEYPDLWPETVRSLIVHSAEWTDAMKQMFLPTNRDPSKSDYLKLLRRCGFGVPNLDRALWSLSNDLTMVIQETLHPFKMGSASVPTNCDMHLHELPWPVSVLEDLGDIQVEMRVTLSYFIEPNPSERGTSTRYRYESHGLRFDVKRPAESLDAFRARINAAVQDNEEGTSPSHTTDSAWLIGKQNRHKGSLHSDVWRGNAADLASRGYIGVYPAIGWWRTRSALKRYNQAARYALVVSINTQETDVDLYSEVTNLTSVPTTVGT